MQQMGNSRARAVYEANLPDNFRRPQTDVALENFIRAKYEHTKYIAQEWVKPAPPRVDWNSEIEEQIRRKKEKNRTTDTVGALPKLGSSKINTSPSISNKGNAAQKKAPLGKVEVSVPVSSAPPAPVQTSASDDLLGLTTGNDFVDPFASPVKSTNSGVPGSAATPATTEDDLGSVFASSGGALGGDAGSGKMSKESILSLYGSLGGGGGGGSSAFAGGGVPGLGATNNPFVTGGVVGQPFGNAGVPANTNPFPQQGWGVGGTSDLGNGFAGLGGLGAGQGQTAQSNLSQVNKITFKLCKSLYFQKIIFIIFPTFQLQQGLFSLNLSSTTPVGAPAPQQNSNVLFNTNAPASVPPPTNLNMLMMNSGGAPQGGGGFFTGLANTSIASPPQMVPPTQQFNMMQQQPQNVAYSQFQSAAAVQGTSPANNGFGVFQNGGSAPGSGAGNHVDLLWK